MFIFGIGTAVALGGCSICVKGSAFFQIHLQSVLTFISRMLRLAIHLRLLTLFITHFESGSQTAQTASYAVKGRGHQFVILESESKSERG